MRSCGLVTFQPSVLLIGRSRPRNTPSLLTGGVYELEVVVIPQWTHYLDNLMEGCESEWGGWGGVGWGGWVRY